MKIRYTILLAVINLLLLWGIVNQIVYPPAQRSFDNRTRVFLPLGRADWDGIAVKTGAASWSATRDRWGHWWLKSPYEWPAKPALMSRMNGYLATLQVGSAFATDQLGRVGQSLRSYGLDNPRAVLEVSSGSKTLSYKIGNVTPLGNKIYVLSPDEREVWVVDAGLGEYIALDAAGLRQDGFFPFNIVELEALELQREEMLTRFERKAGGASWQVKIGEQSLPLQPGSWEGWLNKISATTPAEASLTDTAAQALKSPFARITFQTLYGRRMLILGEVDTSGKRRWAQWEGGRSAFFIPVENLKVLEPESFLETRVIGLLPADVTALDWVWEGASLSLRRLESGAWAMGENAESADPELVRTLLERLFALEGQPRINPKPLADSTQKITLRSPSQTITINIARGGSGVRAWRQGGLVSYELAQWPEIVPSQALLDKRWLTKPIGELQQLSFAVAGRAPVVYALDTPQAQAMVALLAATPRADSWSNDLSAILGIPQYTIEIKTQEGVVAIDWWRAGASWTGRIDGRFFKPSADWIALLQTLATL